MAVVALAVVAAAVPAAVAGTGATQEGASPSFVVALSEDGSAAVTLTLTYDLETEDQQAAFQTLQDDADARTDARDRFASRMSSVATDASAATGRDMRVENATIDMSVTDGGSVGVVELSVTWTDLAAVAGDRLVVTEPFASGFEPDREFTVRGPDGYALASASPAADGEDANAATWSAGSDLSGFQVAFEPTSDDGGSDGSGPGGISAPGFGAGVAVTALAVAALTLARRRRT